MENENVSDIKWTWIQREKKMRRINRQADGQTKIARKAYRKTDRQTGRQIVRHR